MISKLKVIPVFIVLFLLLASMLHAQRTSDLFDQAKALAKEKKYAQAQQVLRDILSKGDDGDVRFYLGLLYSWNGQYDEARKEFVELEKSRPTSLELTNAHYNVEFWSGSYAAALDVLNRGIENHPEEMDLQLKKAKMLNYLDRKREAAAVLEKVLSKQPNMFEARDMLVVIKNSNRKNTVSVNGSADFFSDNTNTWYSSYLQYSRQLSIGSVIGRVNYANRFNTSGYQVEADTYLSLWKGGYSYGNIGFSPSSVFPDFRCGYEYFQKLPKAFEASLGFRYMRFAPSDIILYTGSVGKYYSSYWFSLRPQLRFKQGDVSYSFRLTTRRYFSDPDSYVGLEGSFGTAPDFDHQNIDYSYLKRLKSYGIKATYSQKLADLWVVSSKLSLSRDEVIKGTYRTQTSIDLTVSKAF
jgi:YaiO family outer membrane protein